MPHKHKPEEYVNIRAFYDSRGTPNVVPVRQDQASQEGQPLDVVYFDTQFQCWRNFDFCSPITQEEIQEYKRKHGLPSVP